MPSTPFFPALRAQLAALGRRACQSARQFDLLALTEQFRDLFPAHLLAAEDQGSGSRERIYSLRLTFQRFLWQMLKPGTSCREVVRAVQSLFQSQGWGTVDERASAYIQARQRLPEGRLEQALELTARTADRRVGAQGYLQGRPVKVADCSTTQLADTSKNQALYPQAPGQKPGCGFPLLKFLPLFSLSSGAISQVVTGHWKNHDARLLRQAWELFQKGDVLLVDRAFGDYMTLATLPQRGVDVVARLHGARKVDFRRVHQRLGRQDALIRWRKGYQQSDVLTAQEWAQLPEEITVRIIRFVALIRGRKARVTLVTTLLDPALYPVQELVALYRRRWLANGTDAAALEDDAGNGTVARPKPGDGAQGIAGLSGGVQFDPLPDGRSGGPGRSPVGAVEFQGDGGRGADLHGRNPRGAQSENAGTIVGGIDPHDRRRQGPATARTNRAPSGQAPAKSLSSIEQTQTQIQRNPPPKPLSQKQKRRRSAPV